MEIAFVVRRLAQNWPDIHTLDVGDVARLPERLRLARQKLEAKAFRAAVAAELRLPARRASAGAREANGLLVQW